MDSWQTQSACDLGRAIGAGKIDPVELTDAVLAATGAHPLEKRIYARLTAERAGAEAQAARIRARTGQRRGLLDGVPLSWKDLFDTAGIATEAGSKLLAGRVPDTDAEVLNFATAQGSVCIGKTHMSELAFLGLGYNPSTATPPCVNDDEAVPGGSSSGAAASVAFGLVPAALGSDTGGSVRIPAAWNDLVGLKTTAGRVSLKGCVPLCPSFDTIGPLTRTAEDAAEILALIEGRPAADLRGASLGGVRLAVLETVMLDDVAPAPSAAFESALERLNAGGARIERLALPPIAAAYDLTAPLYTGEAYGIWGERIEADPDAVYSVIRTRFRQGQSVMARDFVAAWEKLEALRTLWAEAAAPFDAVLAPTSPIVPPKVDRLLADTEYFRLQNLAALRNTRLANLLGLCAITLPTGVPSCGVMLIGPPRTEERLLRLAAAAEAALS